MRRLIGMCSVIAIVLVMAVAVCPAQSFAADDSTISEAQAKEIIDTYLGDDFINLMGGCTTKEALVVTRNGQTMTSFDGTGTAAYEVLYYGKTVYSSGMRDYYEYLVTKDGKHVYRHMGNGSYIYEVTGSHAAARFTDTTPKAWYITGGWIDYALDNGLMNGYNGTTHFGVLDNITRGQVATILYRYACSKDSTLEGIYGSTVQKSSYGASAHFKDEKSSSYYTAAINWAYDKGVITGDSKTNYATVRPNDLVTREELCAMIARYSQKVAGASSSWGSVDFSSVKGMGDISSWAKASVEWCSSYGIIGGVKSGSTYTMNPQDTAWRASMAKMITVTVRDVL